MAKANPVKFFPWLFTARITLRKVDRYAKTQAARGIRPYFDTWEEAHRHLLDEAENGIESAHARAAKAKRDIKAAERRLARVKAMEKPTP